MKNLNILLPVFSVPCTTTEAGMKERLESKLYTLEKSKERNGSLFGGFKDIGKFLQEPHHLTFLLEKFTVEKYMRHGEKDITMFTDHFQVTLKQIIMDRICMP